MKKLVVIMISFCLAVTLITACGDKTKDDVSLEVNDYTENESNTESTEESIKPTEKESQVEEGIQSTEEGSIEPTDDYSFDISEGTSDLELFLYYMTNLSNFESSVEKDITKNNVVIQYGDYTLNFNKDIQTEEIDEFFSHLDPVDHQELTNFKEWIFRHMYEKPEDADGEACLYRFTLQTNETDLMGISITEWTRTDQEIEGKISIDGITLDSTIQEIIDIYGLPDYADTMTIYGETNIFYGWTGYDNFEDLEIEMSCLINKETGNYELSNGGFMWVIKN